MTSTRFCHFRVLDHMAIQPRRLLEAYNYGAGINSENECEADPGQTSNVDSTQKTIFTCLSFSSVVHSFIHSAPRIFVLLRYSYSCLIGQLWYFKQWCFCNQCHIYAIIWSCVLEFNVILHKKAGY